MLSPLRRIPRPEARAAVLALVTAVTLGAIKFLAYFLTGSAAIFSDALESIVNVVASGLAIYSLAYAHRPADADHPYGHGKIEFLAAGIEGGMIAAAGLISGAKAVESLLRPVPLDPGRLNVGLLLMAVALAVNAVVGLHLVRTGKQQRSVTLEADGNHLLSDAVTSVATLVGLGLIRLTGLQWVDPVVALLVAGYICFTGVGLLRRAEAGLMDRQDLADHALLERVLNAHVGTEGADPRVCGYHKLRHRHSGRYHWVDFHLVVPADWTIERGHQVATAIEQEIEAALGEGNATAHVEPCESGGCGRCALGARVSS